MKTHESSTSIKMPVETALRWAVLAVAITVGGQEAVSGSVFKSAASPSGNDGPLDPREAITRMKFPDEIEVQLVASEPLIKDPVAIKFDEQGVLWVVEMPDYPVPLDPDLPRQGAVKRLIDEDGDGYYETGSVFAEGLDFATGILPWKSGVIVTVAGQVVHLRDTDGDGRADRRDVLIEGFAEQNTQLRANHPALGLDGSIYVANGLRGGEVYTPGAPDRKVSLQASDLRYDPASHELESVTGVGQFGLTFDDWGNRFVCSNRNPAIQIVFERRDVARNSLAVIASLTTDVARAGESSAIYPISQFWTTSNLHEGQFTAACGVLFFRGDRLPSAYDQQLYTCDPTGNLIHREVLESRGMIYEGRPGRQGIEFLASTDTWFRPVNLEHGPDGSLYVVDMYRAVIEHPDFMPAELKSRRDLRLGNDRGRIYRILERSPKNENLLQRRPQAWTTELAIQALDASNGWHRDTAFRLVSEGTLQPSEEALLQLVQGRSERAAVSAFWLLANRGQIDQGLLNQVLASGPSRLTEAALRWCRRAEREAQITLATWERVMQSEDQGVLREAALTLLVVDSESKLDGLVSLAKRAEGPFARSAILIGVGDQPDQLLHRLLVVIREGGEGASEMDPSLLIGLAAMSGRSAEGSVKRRAWAELTREFPEDQVVLLDRARLEFLKASGFARQLMQGRSPAGWEAGDHQWLTQWRRRQIDVAGQEAAELSERLLGIEAYAAVATRMEPLVKLACDASVLEVRRGAARQLARLDSADAWDLIWNRYPAESPAVRQAVLQSALASPTGQRTLVEAVRVGTLHVAEIDAASRRRLDQSQPEIAQAWKELTSSSVTADRKEVLQRYLSALTGRGSSEKGRELFAKNCANCHRVGGLGVDVAPDISDSRVKTAEQILTDVLLPNQSIDGNYVGYVVTTVDGGNWSGVLAGDQGNSITLRVAGGDSMTILKSEIDTLQSTGLSLMPEGLEQNVTPEEMNDLITFIKNWRYLDGKIPFEQ